MFKHISKANLIFLALQIPHTHILMAIPTLIISCFHALWLPCPFQAKKSNWFTLTQPSCPHRTMQRGGSAATAGSSSAYSAFAWDCLASCAACSGRISSIGSSTRLVKFTVGTQLHTQSPNLSRVQAAGGTKVPPGS